MKLDKERIKEIALNRFHDKHHGSVYDCFTDALEVWMGEVGLVLLDRETFKKCMKILARDHQNMSKLFKDVQAGANSGEAQSSTPNEDTGS